MVPPQTQVQAPVRSLDQRMEALKRANDIRVKRAQLKKDLKSGAVSIEQILGEPPEYVSTAKVIDYETFKANQDVALTDLAWLWNMNRGIYMTPGREEEWTLSVAHTEEAVDAYVRAFEEMAAALTA